MLVFAFGFVACLTGQKMAVVCGTTREGPRPSAAYVVLVSAGGALDRAWRGLGCGQVPRARTSRMRRLRAAVFAKIDLRWSWTVCSETSMCREMSWVLAPLTR